VEKVLSFAKKRALIIGGGVAVVIVTLVATLLIVTASPTEGRFTLAALPSIDFKLGLQLVDIKPEEVKPKEPTYPLTGLPAPNEEARFSRPLFVKIENTPEARPQMGVSSADVVYESLTEAGITRFACIFQSVIPDEVGPVRSARNMEVTLVPQYDALFFNSGANSTVLREIAAAGLADMSHSKASEIYYRVSYRVAPHNLYLSLSKAYALAEKMGFPSSLDRIHELEFLDEFPTEIPNANLVTVPFSYSYVAKWQWDADDKVYYRYMDEWTYDVSNGARIGTTNLVVIWVDYVPLPNVLQGQTFGVNMASSGQATLFIAGKRYDGTWESDGINPPRFKDASGNSIKLAPGKTWFQVLDNGMTITVS